MSLEPGDLCIINFFDRPCARLIAEVGHVEGDMVHARYLDERVEGREVTGRIREVRRVPDFGVRLTSEGEYGRLLIDTHYESVVEYPSGEKRRWQREFPEYLALSDNMTLWKQWYAARFYMKHFSDCKGPDLDSYVLPFLRDANEGCFATLSEVRERAEQIDGWMQYDDGVRL